ncbi:CDP-glycerol glycerophosphotransferase family protein [Anaerocolumna xylanovorans]|uniref:CDP-glycerol glycerophosphotransferase n=1 Tax=Anaerocolumna xylanovorans DSM 12503 TaxID=1121345 RepID=A0A1M7YHN6_9FIRM|nr:CDP-glycerol glycerophosphotransferase family protein [Anaerocolumna xylanovorans]SHO52152.1 CDP-glycerol glycerophosphotransferase [Anaerocolumna xylanovorans DSM 12503]
MPRIRKFLRKCKKKIKKTGKKFVMFLYRVEMKILPVNKRIIIFESNMGRNYTGNPKAIYEEMVRQGLDKKYRCYFMLDNVATEIPGNAVKIRRMRVRYFFLMGIAGVWVSDSRMPNYIKKREGVYYVQTWHGTPLKKLALDMDSVNMAGETDIEKYKRNFFMNTRSWDYLISQNHYSTEIFKRAFAFDKTLLEVGYPRNDVLFYGNNEEHICNLKKQMGLPLDKKIVLYAPTWRDNEYYAKGAYKFNTSMDFSLLREQLGEEYVCIVKYHYLVKDNIDWSTYGGFVYEFNMCEDISALYLVADIMVTDYSSVMFDYSLLRRPMFFFTYDLEDYRDNLRGFYFDFIAEAPGPLVGTTKELVEAIKNYDYKEYEEQYNAFYQKYNHADDGKASAKVVEAIEKIIEGER